MPVLRLERARQSDRGLAVGLLQKLALAALELQQAAEVLRVEEELLRRRAGRLRGRHRARIAADGEALDRVEQRERAERLADEAFGAGLLPGRRGDGIAGEQDDRNRARVRVGLQLAAEADAVQAGHGNVEDDDVWKPRRDRLVRGRRTVCLLHVDVRHLEAGAEQGSQARVVVDDQDVRRPKRRGLRRDSLRPARDDVPGPSERARPADPADRNGHERGKQGPKDDRDGYPDGPARHFRPNLPWRRGRERTICLSAAGRYSQRYRCGPTERSQLPCAPRRVIASAPCAAAKRRASARSSPRPSAYVNPAAALLALVAAALIALGRYDEPRGRREAAGLVALVVVVGAPHEDVELH